MITKKIALEGIFDRIESGLTTVADAWTLRLIIDEMEQDIIHLMATIERELEFAKENGALEGQD